MLKIFRCRKFIGICVSIPLFLLYFSPTSVRARVIATEHVIHQVSERLPNRARVRAFFKRADVIAHLQARGIRCEEALSRVDSLADKEIAIYFFELNRIHFPGP